MKINRNHNAVHRRGILLTIAASMLLLSPCAFSAETSPAKPPIPDIEEEIDQIDRLLMLQYVKLTRFNIHYHTHVNAHQNWRSYTYPIARESGTGLSMTGSIIDLSQRARGFEDTTKVNRNTVRNATYCSIVGQSISGTSSALELAQNSIIMAKCRRLGYSPHAAIKYVKGVIRDTDALLDERRKLELQTTDMRSVHEMERDLFLHIRQQQLSEFRAWSSVSKETAVRENTFYILDVMQNFTRVGASAIALRAFNQPNVAGSGAITSMVGNAIATVNPIVSKVAGSHAGKWHMNHLLEEFPKENPSDELAASLKFLKEYKAHGPDSDDVHAKLLEDVLALSERCEGMDDHLAKESKEINRSRQIAQQQAISGPIIGLTGLVNSITSAVAFYDYRGRRNAANALSFSGRLSQLSGQAYAVTYTPYVIAKGASRNRKLRAVGQTSAQLLQQRLVRSDALETRVRARMIEHGFTPPPK